MPTKAKLHHIYPVARERQDIRYTQTLCEIIFFFIIKVNVETSINHSEQILSPEIENELMKLRLILDRTKKPILTVDILTDSFKKFNMVLKQIEQAFPAAEILQGRATGTEQYMKSKSFYTKVPV